MILRAENLVKYFGEGENKSYAVKEMNFGLDYNEMLYIVGPSGSGKTTLLSMISGILRPNAGKVWIKEQDIWALSDDALADFRLYNLGFVFQDFHLFPKLSSIENAAIPLILQGLAWNLALERAAAALAIMGLQARLDLPPYKLSIGEQQRVAIARAIITEPDLLIFDEPTASLDGETGKRIIEFIKEQILTPKRGIIVVTHDNRIEEYASRIMYMEDGRLHEKY